MFQKMRYNNLQYYAASKINFFRGDSGGNRKKVRVLHTGKSS